MSAKRQAALIVLDGWGYREDSAHNAVHEAHTPVFDSLWKSHPRAFLEASGEAVGLPEGQPGNSEVGHTTIGSGTPPDTDLVRINKAIRAGEFGSAPVLTGLFGHVKKNGSALHVLGVVSDGGVHAHHAHLLETVRAAKAAGVEKLYIHAFTDGRDTAPQSAADYLVEIEAELEAIGLGKIVSLTGRYYSMDRDKNWDRIERFENVLFRREGERVRTGKPSQIMRDVYAAGERDEYMEPIIIEMEEGEYHLKPGDAVFMTNFRPDRARQIGAKLVEFAEGKDIAIAGMSEYDPTLPIPPVFSPIAIQATLAEELSKAGLTQQHVAETDKYAHATYFLNGGREIPHEGEEHVLVKSRTDVKTHDEAPEMRAADVAAEAIKRIEAGVDFTFINFANPDIVGHTGNHDAVVKAVEAVDAALGRVIEAVQAVGGVAFVTADHGNAEFTFDAEADVKHTAHTSNLVPAILVGHTGKLREKGELSDIAPTVLSLFGLPIPPAMTGTSLLA